MNTGLIDGAVLRKFRARIWLNFRRMSVILEIDGGLARYCTVH